MAAAPADPADVVDVVILSDFRLPGGTTSSIAEEVRAQSEAGISTALVHAAGSITNYPNPWSTHIQRILDLPGVRIASSRDRLHAKVLIIRHPTVIYSTRASFEGLTADHVIIVVNHAAVDAADVWHYPVEATDARVRRLFGVDPVWAPIGPVVRQTVLDQTTRVPLRETDWVNIFRTSGEVRRRAGFIGEKPVIGRHSRPQPGKWPATGKDILQAYPDSPDYQVEILGGAQVAEHKLGYVPSRWHVIEFGGEEPGHFLERLDFWVYMHHPDLKEAFGRAAMEALAAGCVAIMPPYLEELFGDAALYATPREVQGIVDEFRADREKFLAQSARAQDFALAFSPEMHIRRLEELGVRATGRPAAAEPRDLPALDGPACCSPPRPTTPWSPPPRLMCVPSRTGRCCRCGSPTGLTSRRGGMPTRSVSRLRCCICRPPPVCRPMSGPGSGTCTQGCDACSAPTVPAMSMWWASTCPKGC
ncbi:glycosyltransferase [Nesterenkonia sp. PF2B19]|uniref:glycosyltransferase n=1 Tax=Nesterenkonia sp. PF2B19 TaxID=1881858 RepID=UPI00111C3D31|nr:glycosyltransferase [Nesterenkonia sp. PF2B19]